MGDALAEVTSWVFADMADPREFLAKMNPTGSELSVGGAATERGRKRERKLAGTGLAASGVATVGGLHAISATVKENKGRRAAAEAGKGAAGKLARVTHLRPSRAAELLGAGWLGLHGVELTGDALALRAQHQKLRANQPRAKIAARAPGQLRPIAKAGGGMLRRIGQAGQFARDSARAQHLHAQRLDFAKPLPRMPGESRAARNSREKKVMGQAGRANTRANLNEAAGSARNSARQVAGNPQVQRAANTAVEGFRRAAETPPPRPLTQNPAATAAAGALAGAAGLSYSQRHRRPIAARAPQDVVDLEFRGEISKLDTDKRLAFGWASISKVDGEEYVDRQGDWIPIDTTEAAAYDYVINSRVGGDMHKRAGDGFKGITREWGPHKVADLVESFVVTPEKLEKMGLPPGSVPEGWWIGMKVHDDQTWADVKEGRRTGFSVHGSGVRKDVTL